MSEQNCLTKILLVKINLLTCIKYDIFSQVGDFGDFKNLFKKGKMTIFECAVKIASVTPVGFSNILYPFSTLLQSAGVTCSKME